MKKTPFILSIVALAGCGPNLDPVPNPISDHGTHSKQFDISKVETNENKNVYWGDLHVHTGLSFDAFIGGTITTCDEAYRYAQGEPIAMFGRKVQLREPLDFAAVTDHSELLGETYSMITKGEKGHNAIIPWYLRGIYRTDSELGVDTGKQRKIFNRIISLAGDTARNHLNFFAGYETTMKAWDITIDAAEKHYEPGKFTTFAGFEWTLADGNAHLHRNVIFKDMMLPNYPVSSLEARNEEALWKWMRTVEEQGGDLLAIPHNTNLAEGKFFNDLTWDGKPKNKEYAQMQQDFERLVEIHQSKGNSEVHPAFWKNDEFAEFESDAATIVKENDYVRFGLKKGVQLQRDLGTNPFKMGLIGSTDTHNGTMGNTEENDTAIGNVGILDIDPENRFIADWALTQTKKTYDVLNPGGLVAVWAEANTRDHIYNALQTREVYATSGNRIKLRFFGGNGFDGSLTGDEMVSSAYQKGVPMGSDLTTVSGKPQFLIWAKKDKFGANLDRIQIIKGWADENGSVYEEIFDVAISENQLSDKEEAVNLETGEWNRKNGSEELKVVWTDEDFNPDHHSFYYVRVLEVPTGSWRLWDQIRYGYDYANHKNLVIQERAWSSPIWYSPN